MTIALAQHQHSLASESSGSLVALIDAIGHERFGPTLAEFLHPLCGAERFAAFRLASDELCSVTAGCVLTARTAVEVIESYSSGGVWRTDTALSEAQRSASDGTPVVVHTGCVDRPIQDLFSRVNLRVSDRVLLYGRGNGGQFGLSILRMAPRATFSVDAVCRLGNVAGLVVSLLAKHAAVVRRAHTNQALMALPSIENCIAATGDLPRREGQVCARVLYGMSSAGIATDLAVSEETIKTYRKRAYQRLSVGSERELLNWYLEHWRHWVEWRLNS